MTNTSGQNVAKAGLQSVAGKLGGKIIDFGTLLVLAQVLVPDDFGLVAMAMTVIFLIEALTEIPLAQPILRAKNPTPDYYDTAFTLGIIRASILAVVVTLSAKAVGVFYDEPRLPLLIAVLTIAPVMRSLLSPRMAVFARDFNMRPDMAINLIGKAASFCVVVAVALATQSYWAIALGTITTPFVMNILSYLKAPYRPRLGLAQWSEFSDIVGWNSVNQLFSAVSFQIDRILLGRSLTTPELGRYALASDLTNVAFQGILIPFAVPLTVAMSKAETKHVLQIAWCKTMNAALSLMGPILVGMAVLGVPIVHSMLGETWREAGPILAMLALMSLPGIFGQILAPLAVALFQPKLIAIRTLIDLMVKLPLMFIGIAWFGLWGAIAARGISGVVAMIFSLTAATRLTGLGLIEQLLCMRRTVCGLIVFAGVCLLLGPTADPAISGFVGRGVLGLEVLAVLGIAMIAHLVVVFGLWHVAGRPTDTLEMTVFKRFAKNSAADQS